MKIEKLDVQHLAVLTTLFDYNDVGQTISECTSAIQKGTIDIFVLYENETPIGELRVMYEHDDRNFAVRGKRAYLFAFRIQEAYQDKGYGTYLLQSVLQRLSRSGYREFMIGAEDDNLKAIHMYQAQGFRRKLLWKQETYQGDSYEYTLYLKT